jgi:hypothetical protein
MDAIHGHWLRWSLLGRWEVWVRLLGAGRRRSLGRHSALLIVGL